MKANMVARYLWPCRPSPAQTAAQRRNKTCRGNSLLPSCVFLEEVYGTSLEGSADIEVAVLIRLAPLIHLAPFFELLSATGRFQRGPR